MSGSTDRGERKRFSVTLTPAYVDAMDGLVETGVYLDHQDVIRDALRRLFRAHRIEPFFPESEEPREN